MDQHDELQQLTDLVEADRAHAAPPRPADLEALRAGGRRRLRRRRLVAGAGALAVAAVLAVPAYVVVDGRGSDPTSPATRTPTQAAVPSSVPPPNGAPTTAPTTAPTSTDAPGQVREEVRVPLPGGRFTEGRLETGTILGSRVEMAPYEGYRQVAYAVREGDTTCLSVGLLVEGRLVRLLCALTAPVQGRFVMWNGYREDEQTDSTATGATYELLGAVPGDTDVSIGPAGGPDRPVTERRTDVLPGYTVFVDQAPWDRSWDPLQPAPLTVTTGDGDRYPLSRRTYVS